MVDWLDTLPQFKLTGITDQRVSAKLRSSVDVGVPLQRRRYTAVPRNINVPMVFTPAQRAAWGGFWIDDLEEGVLAFNWTDPLDNSTVSFRFRSDDPPAFTAAEGGAGQQWNVTFELEILP